MNITRNDLTIGEIEVTGLVSAMLADVRDPSVIGVNGDSMTAAMDGWNGCEFDYTAERAGAGWLVCYTFGERDFTDFVNPAA